MKKPTVLILGATGGIGSAVRTVFLDHGYRVIPVGRNMLDFDHADSDSKLTELLDGADADVIVNAVGVFINGVQDTHQKTFNVNFGSNWSLIRYYHNICQTSKPVKIIMVGSSSYSFGKSQYPLYSASKAALYNLWQASVDMFAGTNISVDLINPMRTRTRMNADHYNPDLPYHDPKEVAVEILKLSTHHGSSCVNMTLEETK
jgi:short-subunit dehydrogenase